MNPDKATDQKTPELTSQRISPPRRGSGWKAFWILLILVLAGLAAILYQWDEISRHISQPLLEEERARCEARLASLRHPIPKPPQPLAGEMPPEAARRWAELTGSYPQWPQDLLEPRSCAEVEEDFKALCQELDRKPYLQGRLPDGGTLALLARTARELSAHPPVASGEMRRPEAVVANAFHLFRLLGKERLGVLTQIMNQEQLLAEPAAMVIYRWLAAQERCWRDNPVASRSALEDYAAFFLNSLGGQGYLRRRSPAVAALTSFYSLVILEGAAREGRNPHGVDLRPHISFCRELLKSQNLVFKDRYLEILSGIEARWRDLSKAGSESRP